MNITIIAAIFIRSFHRMVGMRQGILLAGLGITFYTILLGGDAAVVLIPPAPRLRVAS